MAALRTCLVVCLVVLFCHDWAEGRYYRHHNRQRHSGHRRPMKPTTRPIAPFPPLPNEPVVDPGQYFHFTNYLPFDLYSNYMCALLNAVYPGAEAQRKETCDGPCSLGLGKADATSTGTGSSSTFLKHLESIEQFMGPLRKPVTQYYYQWRKTSYGYKKVYYTRQVPDTSRRSTTSEIVAGIKKGLLGGYSRSNLEKLRRLLNDNLTVCDLQTIITCLYSANGGLRTVLDVANKVKMYYVSNLRSSKHCLAGDDLKRLMVNMVLATNGLGYCFSRNDRRITYDKLHKLLWDRLIEFSLPEKYSKEQREQVGSAMNFLKHNDLSQKQYWDLLDTFVYWQFRRGNVDRPALCYILNNFASGSSSCGIRYVVLRMAEYLKCPSDGDVFPESTTTTTTTTTTTPTTTQFIAPFPPTAPAANTINTTTTNSAQARCGISGMASRIARMEKSDLLVTPRIVGGSVTGSCRLYPWMAFINVGEYQCGGAIIDETHILTAAHCFDVQGSLVKVTVGEYYTRSPEGTEQVFNVDPSGIFVHEAYNTTSKANDIAVLKLDKPIDLNRPCAEPICLESSRRVTNGENCVAAGWGVTRDLGSSTSSRLKSVNLPVFRGTDCEKTFPPLPTGYKLTDPGNQLCAGEPKLGQADACRGDSGSPLVCQDKESSRWVAVGIVSYGLGNTCGRAGIPGVYTRIKSHYEWIQQQLKK